MPVVSGNNSLDCPIRDFQNPSSPSLLFESRSEEKKIRMAASDRTVLQFGPSSAVTSNITAKVHPLVIFNISDCYVRRPDQAERVIGTLLGSVLPDGTVDIRNSYVVPHNEFSDQVLIFVYFYYFVFIYLFLFYVRLIFSAGRHCFKLLCFCLWSVWVLRKLLKGIFFKRKRKTISFTNCLR